MIFEKGIKFFKFNTQFYWFLCHRSLEFYLTNIIYKLKFYWEGENKELENVRSVAATKRLVQTRRKV